MVTNPMLISQFKLISLSNVLYQITSKVIANMMKVIPRDIISKEQSTFVPGRLITENVISSDECIHFMKRSKSEDNSYCALKLDMMKALLGNASISKKILGSRKIYLCDA